MGLADRTGRRARPSAEAARRVWLARFGPEPPAFARRLVTALADALLQATDPLPEAAGALGPAAESLGVLRAQQGHAVAGLVEDLTALRALVAGGNDPRAVTLVDGVLTAAVAAYVDELTAVLESRATRDPLTGLPNRAAFDEALAHELSAAARTSPPALLLVDLDGFKGVNDTDGHLAGDSVLVAVADLLTEHTRGADLACRLGGDEFAVLLPRTSENRAAAAGRRLLAASRAASGLASANARVTLSIGVGWLLHPDRPEDLVALADAALYRVKAAGGDGLEVGRPAVRELR